MKKTGTRGVRSYHHTPIEGYRHIFHSVLRAGHNVLMPDYLLESWSRPGHDLLFTLAGAGPVRIGNRSFVINPGELGWADCQHQTVQWTTRSEPWEFLWVRLESTQLDPITEALDVDANPIFMPRKTSEMVAVFKTIFKLLHNRPVNMEAALHATVGSLIAILFDARQTAASGMGHEPRNARAAPGLATALNAMRLDYRRRWTVEDLARLAGLSAPQFFRRFHQATGSSPVNWLRRERVNQAKRRLCETRDPIRDIAEQVGYSDPLYFSRDFKKLAGVSPRHYRRQEQSSAFDSKPEAERRAARN